MKKEIYELTKKYFGGKLKKEDVVEVYPDYKKDGYTIEEINKKIRELDNEIRKKRGIRYQNSRNNDILLKKDKHFLFKQKFLKPILKELKDWFKRKTSVKDVKVELSDDSFLHFTSNKMEDWNRYSKGWHRAHGPARYTQDIYRVPLSIRLLREYRHLLFADGIVTLNVLEEKETNNIKVYKIKYLKFTKRREPVLAEGWLGEKGGYFYHAESEEKAVKGVLRKLNLPSLKWRDSRFTDIVTYYLHEPLIG